MLKGLCCWGTEYCKCGFLGLTRNQNVKFTYIIFIIIAYAISTMMCSLVSPSDSILTRYDCKGTYEGTYQQCYWQQTMFRVSLVISIIHLGLFFLMLLRNQTSKITNQGAWLPKITFTTFVSIILILLIPSSLLHPIHSIAQYLSVFWYLIQNLILVDFFYTFDAMLNNIAQTHQKMYIVKAVVSFFIVGIAVYFNILTYLQLSEDMTPFLPIVNSIVILIGFILVFLRVFQGNTLMVFGFLVAYANIQGYLLIKHEVNKSQNSGIQALFEIGLMIMCLFLILSPGSNKLRTKKSTINQILALNTSRQEQDTRYVSSNKWIIFHYMFFVICFILPVVLELNTNLVARSEQELEDLDKMYDCYKLINWGLAIGVYVWSLVTARLYPQQDFSELQGYFKEYELN